MRSSLLRRLMLLAAGLIGGASSVFAHGEEEGAGVQIHDSATVVALTLIVVALFARWVLASRPARAAAVAAGLAFFVLWAQPWMNFHETHHLLEGKAFASLDSQDEAFCPVAQIAQTHAGGILPSVALPAQPLSVALVILPDTGALTTRVVPEPASRSPPA